MDNLNLKKQQRSYLKLNRIITTVIFVIISIALIVIMALTEKDWLILVLLLLSIWSLYLLIYFYQGAAYKHFSYAMDEYGLYINRGVFWRKKIIVPRNRVQHTDVNQGPFERRYQLAGLIVHTAGTRNASVTLPGILHTDAETLRESLSFAESNDAV
ncbi:MAG: PH domain-containing protein [Proteobacteria bacterium]|nr:PH domain-containing protein [Pseudomonadota bacterium]